MLRLSRQRSKKWRLIQSGFPGCQLAISSEFRNTARKCWRNAAMNFIASFDTPPRATRARREARPHESVASSEDVRGRPVGGASGEGTDAAGHRGARSIAECFWRRATGVAGKRSSPAFCGLQSANPEAGQNVEIDFRSATIGTRGPTRRYSQPFRQYNADVALGARATSRHTESLSGARAAASGTLAHPAG